MRLFGLFLILAALSGCATVFEGPHQYLTVRTAPVGASCSLERDGELLGVIPSTPGSVLIHRTPVDITVLCNKSGWAPTLQVVKSKFNGATISSILLLPAAGVVGVAASAITDASTGANHSYDPPPYILMQPLLDGRPIGGVTQPIPLSDKEPTRSLPGTSSASSTLALR